jgi:hypothetical protein
MHSLIELCSTKNEKNVSRFRYLNHNWLFTVLIFVDEQDVDLTFRRLQVNLGPMLSSLISATFANFLRNKGYDNSFW